mgnify:CR=1 FL=1
MASISEIIIAKENDSEDFSRFLMEDVSEIMVGHAGDLFSVNKLKSLPFDADEQVIVVTTFSPDGKTVSNYFTLRERRIYFEYVKQSKKLDIEKLLLCKKSALLDDLWDKMILLRCRDEPFDEVLNNLSLALTNLEKNLAVRSGSTDKKFDHWETYASQMIFVFLKLMAARFVPEDDLLGKRGALPKSLFKLLVSYGVLVDMNGNKVSCINDLTIGGTYDVDIDAARKALDYCSSLVDSISCSIAVEKLKDKGPAEFKSIVKTMMEGILWYLNGFIKIAE